MTRFLRLIILAVVLLVLLLFVFANRQWVVISLDPFSSLDEAAFSFSAPMFGVIIVAAMLGVVAGATATWVSQGRYRRAARKNRAEAERWRGEAAALKNALPAQPSLPRY